MKADLSRSTFDPDKQYTGVLLQQGRVSLDADWNEQQDIVVHHERTALTDVIGLCGAPVEAAGFEVTVSSGKLRVGAGRYYVAGLLVENPAQVAIDAQPFWPGADLPTENGLYAVVLDVHERLVTALEDPAIREVALGGADHGARRQVVWQARLVRTQEQDAAALRCDNVSQDPDVAAYAAGSTGWLQARTEPGDADVDPCTVPAEGGYRGLENQLYRVEIRQGTHALVAGKWQQVTDEPTFTWSRENGSVVTGWLARSGQDFTVTSLGRDRKLGFEPGQWVELHADGLDLARKAGPLYRVTAAEGDRLTLDLGADSPALATYVGTPRIRRWDAEDGELDVKSTWTPLEHGLQVRFKKSLVYRTGDYWMIPARSLTGLVEWAPNQQVPHGPGHHHCVLAIARRTGSTWTVLHDCRELFPPATASWDLHYVGGDGQHGLPGEVLPVPLQVRVANGGLAGEGHLVEFRLDDPDEGELVAAPGSDVVSATPSSGPARVLRLRTGSEGHAAVAWRLGRRPSVPRQTVTAVRLDASGIDTPSRVQFNGTILRAQDVRYDAACKNLAPTHTVAAALDRLCANAGLHYAGGDGQVGRPGEVLPLSLRVRVTNGTWPRKGALVRFEVLGQMSWGRALTLEGAGAVKGANPVPWGRGRGEVWSDKYVVETDQEGLAKAQWKLGTESRLRAQRVRATLLDDAGRDTALSITFVATISRSDPKVRVVLTDGREIAAKPGAVLPLVGFAGLRFQDILVARPAAHTPPMAWWPGVRVTLLNTVESEDSTVGFEIVLPGLTTPHPDDSLLWSARTGTAPAADAPVAFARSVDTTISERFGARVDLSGSPFGRTGDRITLSEALPTGVLDLDLPRFDAAAPADPADQPAAHSASVPAAQKVARRFLLRVHLRPWTFPEDCAGNAADFETWYWLDSRAMYKVGG